jgi:dTDP-glucose 4,6-dehydratase
VYNIGGSSEKTNLEVVRTILKHVGKPESLITFVKDRPGHDRRYAIDSRKTQSELGWRPGTDFDTGIAQTVEWYASNQTWLDQVVSGDYRKYYQQMYGQRGPA